MTEQIEEVTDPQGLLKSYRELQDDVKGLRVENKSLKAQVENTDEGAVDKWKARAVRAEAKLQLESDGVKDAGRILKYIKFDGVDFDDDDNLVGFEAKLDEVKTDFPELFDKRRRSGGKADIHATGEVERKKSSTESAVDAMLS